MAIMSMAMVSLDINSNVVLFREPHWSTDAHFGSGSLKGVTVVITGANSGLGLYTAAKLYEKGARVIAGVRSQEKFLQAKAELEQIIVLSRAAENTDTDCALTLAQAQQEHATGSGLGCNMGSFEFPAPLDLSEPESVEAFAQATLALLRRTESEGPEQAQEQQQQQTQPARIDILINNAGIMGTARAYNSQGIELQMATNHFGHALLTSRLMSALLETSDHGNTGNTTGSTRARNPRIVNLASVAHELTRSIRYDDGAPHYNVSTTTATETTMNTSRNMKHMNPFDIYLDSKLANILYTNALAYAAATTAHAHHPQINHLTVVSCHPGWTHTNLQRRSVIGKLFHLISTVVGMPPSKGAESVLRAALDVSPNLESMSYVGPRYKGWGSPVVQKAKPWAYDIAKVAEFVQWSDRYMYQGTPTIPSIILMQSSREDGAEAVRS
jgi:NAD(P)-dependent dehydrogenase (short-subunit alcohol dehydrogenase family)